MKITHTGKTTEFWMPAKSLFIKEVDSKTFEVWQNGKRPKLISTEVTYTAAETVALTHLVQGLAKELRFLSGKLRVAGRRVRVF